MNLGRKVVGLVNYQAGNLKSIGNAFEHLGVDICQVRSEKEISRCTHLVLPGVGAFGFCANNLAVSAMASPVERWGFELKRPLLGICVGMQLLADRSEESPGTNGLGWIGGRVERLASNGREVRVPHVGWNTVRFDVPYGGFGAGEEADFYFDHSYAYIRPERGETLAHCEHGVVFSAVVRRENLVAAQFHPEKSQSAGLRFLRGFLNT